MTGERDGGLALRFVAERARLVERRPAVLAGALAARGRLLRGYAEWPDPAEPMQVVPLADRRVARWVRSTFEPGAARRLDDATWSALRARGLILPRGGPGIALSAAERALGRPLDRPVVGCVSASGHAQSKLLCFVFERGEREPSIVVKGVPLPGRGARLVSEAETVERIRARVGGAPEVLAGMPPAPLWIGAVGDDELVVEPVDPLAAATGEEDRTAALAWLDAFQRAAAEPNPEPWGDAAELAEMERAIDFAWRHSHPDGVAPALERFRALVAPLIGAPVPRCAVHGDFWRGNIACVGGDLRVYDWEWASESGRPFFDVWTYELGSLRSDPPESVDAAAALLAESERRIEDQLVARGLDPRFARATLVPVVAELLFRVRRVLGEPPQNEHRALQVVAAVERLLFG